MKLFWGLNGAAEAVISTVGTAAAEIKEEPHFTRLFLSILVLYSFVLQYQNCSSFLRFAVRNTTASRDVIIAPDQRITSLLSPVSGTSTVLVIVKPVSMSPVILAVYPFGTSSSHR